VEREYSINGFHQQINLVERTWSDDLRAMFYDLGIAIGVLVNPQDRASEYLLERLGLNLKITRVGGVGRRAGQEFFIVDVLHFFVDKGGGCVSNPQNKIIIVADAA
jgi:hypothetical protein